MENTKTSNETLLELTKRFHVALSKLDTFKNKSSEALLYNRTKMENQEVEEEENFGSFTLQLDGKLSDVKLTFTYNENADALIQKLIDHEEYALSKEVKALEKELKELLKKKK